MEKQKPKMTLDRLAAATQKEFTAIRKEIEDVKEKMATKKDLERFATKKDLEQFATKKDLELYATKEDLTQFKEEIIEEVKHENRKVLLSNDKVITKLDILLKENAAHTIDHQRIDTRLDRLEKVVFK